MLTSIFLIECLGDDMVSLKERFQFLENGDFPFYNDIPKLSVAEWLLLVAAVILMLLIINVIPLPLSIFPVAIGLVMLIPALYVCKGNYSLFFKKPKLRDILLIILCFFGYYLYVALVASLLGVLGIPTTGNAVLTEFQTPSLYLVVSMLMQLAGEEFFKIFMLLITMYVVYRLTANRTLAIWMGVIVSLFIFGMAHFAAFSGSVLQILLVQGLGSIFDLYLYMKTKNVVVSYLMHVMIDFIPFILVMLGVNF